MPQDLSRGFPHTGVTTANWFALVDTTARLSGRWFPSCCRWVVQYQSSKSLPISLLSPWMLRKFWARDYVAGKNNGDGYCSPRIWRIFWSLKIPHKVVNCWWRLLKNCLSTQSALHQSWTARWSTPECQLCYAVVEDLYHFCVGCPHKWSFWSQAGPLLSLQFLMFTPLVVWAVVSGLHIITCTPVDPSHLELVGCILEILWRYHWYCVTRQSPWSIQAAISMLMSSVTFKITMKAQLPLDDDLLEEPDLNAAEDSADEDSSDSEDD